MCTEASMQRQTGEGRDTFSGSLREYFSQNRSQAQNGEQITTSHDGTENEQQKTRNSEEKRKKNKEPNTRTHQQEKERRVFCMYRMRELLCTQCACTSKTTKRVHRAPPHRKSIREGSGTQKDKNKRKRNTKKGMYITDD